jgi:hypothetical protein
MPPQNTVAILLATTIVFSTTAARAQDATPPNAAPSVQRDQAGQSPELGSASPSADGKDTPARLHALQQAIEADRQRLIVLITERAGDPPPLRDDPELLAIAERLPRLEEELRVLKELTQQQPLPAKAARP